MYVDVLPPPHLLIIVMAGVHTLATNDKDLYVE